MKKLDLILCLHHHQPLGNFRDVLENCYQKCYDPILSAIESHPDIVFNLSYSGPLLEFFLEHHPDYISRLKTLIHAGRVEVLSDGFYEPILAELDEPDRQGQLNLMREWQKEHLGFEPKGVWLAEGVWDPSLAKTFRQVGLHYSILRSARFVQAGLNEGRLRGRYVTEHLGYPFHVFPIDINLMRLIPFGKVEELFGYLIRLANRNGRSQTISFADNAERWGIWPGSYEKVQESGYLERLFVRLAQAKDWLRLITFSQHLDKKTVPERCYLPPGSRWEIGAWSLPDAGRQQFARARRNLKHRHDSNIFLPFFRAGSYAGFRTRYLESHLMEKKGTWLKQQNQETLPKASLQEFKKLLWQSQCNTAYWFGTSGGIYQPYLRAAIWQRLISAEAYLAQNRKGWEISQFDFDANSRDEIIVTHPKTTYGINPDYGGACFEISLIPSKTNLTSHLNRRSENLTLINEEIEIAEQPETTSNTIDNDWYQRHCFQDHIVNRHTTAESLASNENFDLGDFIDHPFRVVDHQTDGKTATLTLKRKGGLYRQGKRQPLLLKKTYQWGEDPSEVTVRYEIENISELPLEAILATEHNLFLPTKNKEDGEIWMDKRSQALDDPAFDGFGKEIGIASKSVGVRVSFSLEQESHLWSYPLFTSISDQTTQDRTRQGNALLTGWPFDILPGKSASFQITMRIEQSAP